MEKDNVNRIPEADVAVSSRIRLARNLQAYPFTPGLSESQSGEILEKVRNAVFNGRNPEAEELSYIDIQSLKPIEKQLLVEKHLISPDFAEGDRNRAAIISNDEIISIMVNEEDHLRLQCIFPGMQLIEAWKLCDRLDSQLEESLDFAFDRNYGYLTCCPTNIGTGIRASVMMHLPALSMTGYIKGILDTCSKLGVAVRGIYGENSEATGNMFQISNQVTLGQTEEEIISSISAITTQIIEQERMLRTELYKQNSLRFEDRIFRSLGLLSNARIISTEEGLKLLSDVKLGVIMELMKGIELEDLNELTLAIQPGYLQKLCGAQLSPEERDKRRAELLRKRLAIISVK